MPDLGVLQTDDKIYAILRCFHWTISAQKCSFWCDLLYTSNCE